MSAAVLAAFLAASISAARALAWSSIAASADVDAVETNKTLGSTRHQGLAKALETKQASKHSCYCISAASLLLLSGHLVNKLYLQIWLASIAATVWAGAMPTFCSLACIHGSLQGGLLPQVFLIALD